MSRFGPPRGGRSRLGAPIRAAGAVALLLLAPACARHEFLRISEDCGGGRLEAAWIWFAPPPGYPPVLLVNMVHLGAPEYFDEVQDELDRAAVVFMEGIRACESAPASNPACESLLRLERATLDLAFELRLVTQRESLVVRPEYESVDWTAAELDRRSSLGAYVQGVARLRETVQRIVDQEVSLLRPDYPGLSWEELSAFVRRGPLRRQVAERLAEAPVEDSAIIRGRNQEVLRRLVEKSPTGLVAICYGADHGPHFARSLAALGYRRRLTTWHRVFRFDKEPRPDVVPRP